MRELVALFSSALALIAIFGARSAPAATPAEGSHAVLTCKANGSGCDSGGDCCSKNCCAINNHNRCVSRSASQHLSCR